jgi:hypothetical protein
MLKIPWGISDTGRQNSHSFIHSSYLSQMSLLVGLTASTVRRVRSYRQSASSPRLPRSHSPGGWTIGQWWPRFWDVSLTPHNQSISPFIYSAIIITITVMRVAKIWFHLEVIFFIRCSCTPLKSYIKSYELSKAAGIEFLGLVDLYQFKGHERDEGFIF